MAKRWTVNLPVVGYAIVEVEADTEEAAIEAALEQGATVDDLQEWEVIRHVARGNVLSHPYPDADAVLESDGEDE